MRPRPSVNGARKIGYPVPRRLALGRVALGGMASGLLIKKPVGLLLLVLRLCSTEIAWAQRCGVHLDQTASRSSAIFVTPALGHVVIPVYSDIHGRIETLFKSLSQLQKAQKTSYPVVLITGDLGWFPYPNDLSPLLRRIEIKSETDLGFSKFNREVSDGKAEGGGRTIKQRYFEDAREPLKLDAKFYFLRGNHEDHEILKDRELSGDAIIPADPSATFNYLADGRVIKLQTPDGHRLNVGILGGVHAETRPGRTIDNPLMVFDQKAVDGLIDTAGQTPLDVLLTHQGPASTNGGHAEIDTLIEVLKPKVHVHGHSGQQQAPNCIAGTPSHCVPDLDKASVHAYALDWNLADGSVRLINL